MSDKVFGPLVSGEDIKREQRKRSSKLNFQTLKASKISLVLEKVKIEEKEGWKRHKKYKKSYVVSRPKPVDEQLEDELWCIVARMGFSELSSGRNFRIETKRDPNPRQIDIFAKDDEVALIIECTQKAKPTTSSKANVDKLITKISDFKGRISKEVTNHYGRDSKVKPKFIIATRNIDWGNADIEKCKNENISILSDMEIDYYNALTTHLKTAARFQLLAHLFSGTEIPGLSKTVPATMGTMGGVNFYNFLIKPKELMKIAYVGHKASRSIDSLETYQRMLQPKRLNAIASFIGGGGKFPTNIVINIKTPRKRKLDFKNQSPKDDKSIGLLKLPSRYGSAWVIDGQHRLYGYAHLDTQDGPKDDTSVLPVLAFENLPPEDEMDMFIDINSKQVKVKTSLLLELYGDLHWNSEDPAEKLLALQARTVVKLNGRKTSPIFDRVVVTGKGKNQYRCLTATSISDGIKQTRLLGSVKKDVFHPGPLSVNDPDDLHKSLTKASNILMKTLQIFEDTLPEHWQAGDKQGVGYLCTNIGIRSIMLVIMDICNHVRIQQSSDLSIWTEKEIMDEIQKYIQPVVDYFKSSESDQIQSFRRQGSSLASVKKQSMGMNVFIQKKFPEYSPDGLDTYVSKRDQEGNDKAILMINRIKDKIFPHVLKTLKKHFKEEDDEWWLEGIPGPIRIDCSTKREEDKCTSPKETYLQLINYQDIARLNWDLFSTSFALGEKNTDDQKKNLAWIRKLSKIHKKTDYPDQGKLTPVETKFVEEVSTKVDQYFI